jgi:DNA invertase Pin-like site-specific DNA recombinase
MASTHCIVYARFSDRPDRSTSQSNVTQLDLCRKYAQRMGYEIAGEFTDEAKSGRDRKRVGLNSAIEALKPGYVLLAYSSSRLARDYLLAEHIYKRVAKHKAFVEFVDERKRVSNDPMEVCMRQVKAAFEEFERKQIGKRTSDSLQRAKANGYAINSTPPYGEMFGEPSEVTLPSGAVVLKKTWVKNPEEQAVIERIRSMRDSGMSFAAIGRQLDAEGVPARGTRWSHPMVGRICRRVEA